MARYWSTHLSLEEFKAVGFHVWPGYGKEAPTDAAEINEKAGWMLRDNSLMTPLTVSDYPKGCPDATAEHLAWVKAMSKNHG